MHVCPELRNLHVIAPATASSRSASSKTMNGAFPPSSSEIFLRPGAHWAMRSLPTSVEPVKPSLRTAGFEVISPPIAGASSAAPVTTEKTPAGTPASSASAAIGESAERRLLGRLEHHRAARRERGRGLPRRHRGGEVPRRDACSHADRLLRHVDALVGPRRRDRVAVDALRLLAEPLVEGGGVRDLDARLRERLSLLGHHEPREVVLVLEHEVGEPPQHTRRDPSRCAPSTRGARARQRRARDASRQRPCAARRRRSRRSRDSRRGRSRRSRRRPTRRPRTPAAAGAGARPRSRVNDNRARGAALPTSSCRRRRRLRPSHSRARHVDRSMTTTSVPVGTDLRAGVIDRPTWAIQPMRSSPADTDSVLDIGAGDPIDAQAASNSVRACKARMSSRLPLSARHLLRRLEPSASTSRRRRRWHLRSSCRVAEDPTVLVGVMPAGATERPQRIGRKPLARDARAVVPRRARAGTRASALTTRTRSASSSSSRRLGG